MPTISRNLLVLWAAIFLIASGEELWVRFIPRYIEALGGSVLIVAAYGTAKDLLDAVYQFPGGAATARLGTKQSLVVFNVLAILGYALLAFANSWALVLLALPFIMAWQSFSLPATFSMVGDALPKGRRSMGFAWQSIARRIPIVAAPIVGGMLIASYGIQPGIRAAISASIVLGLVALAVQVAAYRAPADHKTLGMRETLAGVAQLDPRLKLLLASDIIVRFGQGLGEVFVVLYALSIVGVSATQFGILIGVAMMVSIGVYIPVARIADRSGSERWVTLTYACFAAFPLSLIAFSSPALLFIPFVLMGMREIGEPPRKALIVDLARDGRKSVDVGAYYFVRGLAVFPASLIGGLLWRMSPKATFLAAGIVALAGAILFYMTLGRWVPPRAVITQAS